MIQFTLLLQLALFSLIRCYSAPDYVNLEESAQDFVLETKRIIIPGYPDAFNPSIVKWQGKNLMSFRFRDKETGNTDPVGLVWLDSHFEVKGTPQILQIDEEGRSYPSRAQDPRLIKIGENLFVVYSNVFLEEGKEVRRVMYSRLIFDGSAFSLQDPEAIHAIEGKPLKPIEKNWVPFVYNRELYLSYTIVPHRVYQPVKGAEACRLIAETKAKIEWPWGDIRGGTQALKLGNEYLSFFHCWKDMFSAHSNGKKISHYFIAAYTFSAEPPFELKRVSPEPIFAKGFYQEPYYITWKPLRCVFPCGYIVEGDNIWISYGRQDHEVWVMKLDKKGLLKSLVPLETEY
ncbi:hypothetical protein [Estrella lausannensis]|uniref:hypothetical protein n=1 Tax=Estrella lausannensis TaxID=483423 RepID=UPI001303F975|nr:hypothetical protein [Estrella lausannensis]